MSHILLVEDDESVREAVKLALEEEQHRVDIASSGPEALAMWRERPPDVILLDVMLPGSSGIEVCREIRSSDRVPIVMLTAKADPVDVILGLEAGADDYVTKPFDTRVLLARIRAVLRRAKQAPSTDRIVLGDIVIEPGGMTVTRAGQPVRLSVTEFRLLNELARRPGQIFTRELLLDLVWDYQYLGDSRLVDVCVQRLRAKIEIDRSQPQLIHTVRGVGYKLVAP